MPTLNEASLSYQSIRSWEIKIPETFHLSRKRDFNLLAAWCSTSSVACFWRKPPTTSAAHQEWRDSRERSLRFNERNPFVKPVPLHNAERACFTPGNTTANAFHFHQKRSTSVFSLESRSMDASLLFSFCLWDYLCSVIATWNWSLCKIELQASSRLNRGRIKQTDFDVNSR